MDDLPHDHVVDLDSVECLFGLQTEAGSANATKRGFSLPVLAMISADVFLRAVTSKLSGIRRVEQTRLRCDARCTPTNTASDLRMLLLASAHL